jgi:hypothetical protein
MWAVTTWQLTSFAALQLSGPKYEAVQRERVASHVAQSLAALLIVSDQPFRVTASTLVVSIV